MVLDSYRHGAGGVDPHFSNVVSLLHLDGTHGSTTFTDEKGVTWGAGVNGVPSLSTSSPMFGTASLRLAQSGGSTGFDSLDGPNSLITNSSAENAQLVTIEGWAKMDTHAGFQYGWNPFVGQVQDVGSGDQMLAFESGRVRFYRGGSHYAGGADAIGTTVAAINLWHHVAMTYDGTNIRTFLNGNLEATLASAVGWAWSNQPVKIGMNMAPTFSSYRLSLVGFVDEFRVTRNVARYTSSFTPPVAPFPNS